MNKQDQDLNGLLDYLRRNRGIDFSGYKNSSITRRIVKRMQMVGVENYNDYIDFLEVHPEEFTMLFNTVLINVTSFFRDPELWDTVRENIVPKILEEKAPEKPIRIWSAGCASGEEAYTLAMIFAEALGENEFHNRVKIYATDLDEEALFKAHMSIYSEREVEGVPPDLLVKYFEPVGNRYQFRKDIRRSVIFGRHDLIQDAPISKIDLLSCRNTLMYFNAETQSKVLARLHFALNDNGFLFLGRAEMLMTHANLFNPLDLKGRVFVRSPRITVRDRLMVMAQTGNEDATNHLMGQMRLRDLAFEKIPQAQMMVDNNGVLVMANERARQMFAIAPQDIGKRFHDLQISYRPVELRSYIDQAIDKRDTVVVRDVSWSTERDTVPGSRTMEIQVIPLLDEGTPLGVTLLFSDITHQKQLQEKLEHTNQELETTLEELQSTNEELQTTNEELQSTIEELETTNEELQSTNEELETMNEELQSTNEELETMNEEMRVRTEELNHINAFMESILTSLSGAVTVLDQELRVQVWNHKSEDLWGLRSEEVEGHNFLGLDIGLPLQELYKPLRAILNDHDKMIDLMLNATNRRGRKITCNITLTPLYNTDKTVQGVIMIIQEARESVQ